eukprot:13981910-Alexandrium_andersonii.AAC.1
MSASLVGSEMCIRDRWLRCQKVRNHSRPRVMEDSSRARPPIPAWRPAHSASMSVKAAPNGFTPVCYCACSQRKSHHRRVLSGKATLGTASRHAHNTL